MSSMSKRDGIFRSKSKSIMEFVQEERKKQDEERGRNNLPPTPNESLYKLLPPQKKILKFKGGVCKSGVFKGGKFHALQWIKDRRKDLKEGRLEPWKIDVVEEVPGWTWGTRRDAQFAEGVAMFKRFIRETGQHPTTSTVYQGHNLGGWIANRRREKGEEKLSDERQALLTALEGWLWEDPNAVGGRAKRSRSPPPPSSSASASAPPSSSSKRHKGLQ